MGRTADSDNETTLSNGVGVLSHKSSGTRSAELQGLELLILWEEVSVACVSEPPESAWYTKAWGEHCMFFILVVISFGIA